MSPADVAAAAQLACLLEASTPKPGNVSPLTPFHDTRYEDFLASAAAIAPAFLSAPDHSLGETILSAIIATMRWSHSNTNLGVVLLLAPLAHAALDPSPDSLRQRLHHVLATTTVQDAADTYEAIRLARPAGLGRAATQDVADAPTVTLSDAMRLAAQHDGIAHEYTTGFATTFETGAPTLLHARHDGLPWNEAIVETYLTLLATHPDTHIARKLGDAAAADISARAQTALDAGATRTTQGRDAIARLDHYLRDPRNTRNPGTTADLTAAAIYVVLLDGHWR